MLHIFDAYIREHLLDCRFGLEKESLRVLSDGSFSHTPHPSPGDKHIVRDFCENQIEINTDPYPSAEEAIEALCRTEAELKKKLSLMPEPEYLWPFSNPPYIKNEDDIPIAIYTGDEAWKTEYRKHLSGVYGRYKMTFSGIHVNYSFDEELLRREAELCASDNAGIEGAGHGGALDEESYRKFKDDFYISLTEKISYCGWLLVAITSASPVIDGSFTGAGAGETVNTGMSSLRCSERGYWNFFDPVFDYTSLDAYADSIEKYVKEGKLNASSELYYPVRLKPNSAYSVDNLRKYGAGHIELRMYDLDPFESAGMDIRDVKFAGYLIVFLASLGDVDLTKEDQINIVRNFKTAAHYDFDSITITGKCGAEENIRDAAIGMIDSMDEYYASMLPDNDEIKSVLDFERAKFTDDRNRYASRVLEEYGEGFVRKGLELVKHGRS